MLEQRTGLFKSRAVLAFPLIIAVIEFIRMSLFLTFLPSFLTNLNNINPGYHYTTAALGLITSLNLVSDNLCKSATGWLVDRYGPWPVLFTGSIIVFLSLLLIINYYNVFLILILSSILIGIGVSPTWPASISGALQITGEEKRATMISLISVIWLIGGGSGTILAGFLINSALIKNTAHLHSTMMVFLAHRAGFIMLLIMSAAAIGVCLLGWFGWQRSQHKRLVTHDPQEEKPNFRSALNRLWTIKGLIPGMFVQTFALGMLIPNLLPYATKQLGISQSEYSVLLLIGGLITIAFMIPVGHLADHWGTKGFLVAGFTLASSSLALMMLYGNSFNIWIVAGMFGLSYALIQPAWNALMAASIPPNQRGILMGLFMAVEGMGFGFGPAVGGYLGTLSFHHYLFGIIGPGIPFYVSSILLALMALVYFIYPFHQYHFEEK